MTFEIFDIGIILIGYIAGSLTFSIWITKLVKKVDVRDGGSHHATTTKQTRT